MRSSRRSQTRAAQDDDRDGRVHRFFLPIMWTTGAGSDAMKRIAAPMIGGLATSFHMELYWCTHPSFILSGNGGLK